MEMAKKAGNKRAKKPEKPGPVTRRRPQYHLTLNPDLVFQVRRLAELQGRSLSNMLDRVIGRGLLEELERERAAERGTGEAEAPLLWDFGHPERNDDRQLELLTWLHQSRKRAGLELPRLDSTE
jgi:hypothetical protein